MTREEIKNKLFDIILKNSSPTMVVKRTIDYQQTMVIVEELINHETDLLKEFVNWYKEHLVYIQEHEKELLDDDVKHEYSYLVEYRKGTTDMIDRLISWLDNNLKRFLEEKK